MPQQDSSKDKKGGIKRQVPGLECSSWDMLARGLSHTSPTSGRNPHTLCSVVLLSLTVSQVTSASWQGEKLLFSLLFNLQLWNICNSTKVSVLNTPRRQRDPHICTSEGGLIRTHRGGSACNLGTLTEPTGPANPIAAVEAASDSSPTPSTQHQWGEIFFKAVTTQAPPSAAEIVPFFPENPVSSLAGGSTHKPSPRCGNGTHHPGPQLTAVALVSLNTSNTVKDPLMIFTPCFSPASFSPTGGSLRPWMQGMLLSSERLQRQHP